MHTLVAIGSAPAWIDVDVDGRTNGADILVTEKFEGKGQGLDAAAIHAMIGQPQRDFVAALLEEHGIPADGMAGQSKLPTSVSISDEAGEQLLDVAFRHPIKLIASALGTPPPFMIERARQAGVPIAALVGAKAHAIKQVNAR